MFTSGRKMCFCSMMVLSAVIATPGHGQSVTSKIKNASFEVNGLEGWDSDNFWIQTNTATTSQGWRKTGNTYAESWVATPSGVGDAHITQRIEDLQEGIYTVQANAHAVLESNSNATINGVTLIAGSNATSVTKGGTYSCWAIVLNGHITIGVKAEGTNANWVATDYFRLTKSEINKEKLDEYGQIIYNAAVSDTLNRVRQIYFNREQIKEAMQLYIAADGDSVLTAESIRKLETARERFDSIKVAYNTLRDRVNELYNSTNKSKFAGADEVKNIRSLITRYYRSPDDNYGWVLAQIERLDTLKRSYAEFLRLGKFINMARDQVRLTSYPGADIFQTVIDKAVSLQSSSTDSEEMRKMKEELDEAQGSYIKNRPSEWVTIQNGNMLRERNGDVQAHAPGFCRIGDIWYMVGEDRTRSPDVNLYSSIDLVHWNFERKIIENGRTSSVLGNGRMIERPKILYNPDTEQFVVWCHWEQGDYGASEAACFFCDEVKGDYQQAFAGRPLGIKSRDCNVFVDKDGKAYFISTTEDNNHIGLFELSDDYLSVVNHTQLFPWQGREAPATVRIGNIYYMFSSACSGWDPNQCKLATTSNLRSGWSPLNDIGNDIAFDTQAAAILEIKGTKATTYLYVGDRWQDPGLPESKTIMFPVTFNGTTCDFKYRERFDINFVTGEWRETPTDEIFVDKTEWNVISYSSEETQSEPGNVKYVCDNDWNTKWHTKYTGGISPAPHQITIDMGKETDIQGFLAVPRMDRISSGLIRNCTFSTSADGNQWRTQYATGWLPYCTEIDFDHHKARYFRLSSNESFISLAEIEIVKYSDPTVGISQLSVDNGKGEELSPVVDTEWFSIDGRRVGQPAKGVSIARYLHADGTITSKKVLR